MSDDHKEIFLQPPCCVNEDIGRLWCEHDAPENCEDGTPWTKYVRADLYDALQSEVERLRAQVAGNLPRRLRSATQTALPPYDTPLIAWLKDGSVRAVMFHAEDAECGRFSQCAHECANLASPDTYEQSSISEMDVYSWLPIPEAVNHVHD
jgi:hypothetical protein